MGVMFVKTPYARRSPYRRLLIAKKMYQKNEKIATMPKAIEAPNVGAAMP